MKIIFLARRFYPQIGGVEKHLMEISIRLIARGHSVTVIAERVGDGTAYEEVVHGISVYRIDAGQEGKAKKLRIWKELLRLQDHIKDADVVHCHDVFFWYLPFRFLYPQKPVYTTFHGYESYPIAKNAIRIRKLSERLSWGNICIGDFISKWYGTQPTYVSYGGVSLPPITSREKVKTDSAIFYGRLTLQTGIDAYVKAVEIVKKNKRTFTLLVIGDGEYKKKLKKDIKVYGFQNNPEKYFQTYRFAFVSGYLSMLEAFAAKRLVFAVYDNPLKEDYLRMTPYANFISIEKDYNKLAEKVLYYIDHPEEEKILIQKAYEWVKQQEWENVVNVYLQLWKK